MTNPLKSALYGTLLGAALIAPVAMAVWAAEKLRTAPEPTAAEKLCLEYGGASGTPYRSETTYRGKIRVYTSVDCADGSSVSRTVEGDK